MPKEYEYAPVILFVYNRPDHTSKVLEALDKNVGVNESELFIFSDYFQNEDDKKRVQEVRHLIKKYQQSSSFRKVDIIEAESHKGLAKSVISGVSTIINMYGKVIVLEDDLVTSIDFIKFMNGGLKYYENEERVWSIAGYTPDFKGLKKYDKDVYMCLRAGSWGWGTWKDRWDSIDWDVQDYLSFVSDSAKRREFGKSGFDLPAMLDNQMQGKIDSWAIRFCYSQFKQGKLTVNPTVSRVNNIGFDGSGTHSSPRKIDKWKTATTDEAKRVAYIPVELNKRLVNSYYNFFAGNAFYRTVGRMKSRIYNIVQLVKRGFK